MEYVDGQPYLAQVTDQGFTNDKNGNPFFKLHIKILGKVNDKWNPEKDLEPINSVKEEEIQFRFDESRPDLVEWRVRDLQKLGFTGDDLAVLNPTHSKHQSFVGNKLLVKPFISDKGDRLMTFWNLLFVGKAKANKVDADEVSSKLGDAFKKAKARLEAKEKEEAEEKKEKEAVKKALASDLPNFAKK